MKRRTLIGILSYLPFTGSARALEQALADPRDVRYLRPGDDGFATARLGFNRRITRQPGLIARPLNETGVRQALTMAAEAGLPVGIRSGGHCFEGHGQIEGGLLLDLGELRALIWRGQRVSAGPGHKLGGFYAALASRGRLLPAGSCAGVGLAGLTLGGGYGFFAREFGLTADHLRRVVLIDAAGERRDSDRDAELLWACQGGGNGHFGAVTELEYETRELPAAFSSYRFRYRQLDLPRVRALAERWCAEVSTLPAAAYSSFVMNGRTVTVLVTESRAEPSAQLAPILAALSKDADELPPARHDALLAGIQRFSGGTAPMYFRNFSTGYYRDWSDLARGFDAMAEIVLTAKPTSIWQINTLGGAISEGRAGAYTHRSAALLGEFQTYYERPDQADAVLRIGNQALAAIDAAQWRAHYVNYPCDAFKDSAAAYYGANLKRLVALKRRLDPERRFAEAQALPV